MQTPLEISWHHVEKSAALEEDIRKHFAKLEQISNEIISCRVTIELPHVRHQQGNIYSVRLLVKVPDKEIVVDKHADNHAHEDPYVCVRDAFEAARKQLDAYRDKRHA
jgi:ribosome-associated translation inhibitor RaiA